MGGLATFLKDAKKGKVTLDNKGSHVGKMYLELIERYGVPEEHLSPDLVGPRSVIKVCSNGVELIGPYDRVSKLVLERASLVDYDGSTLCVYDPAIRELYAEEIIYKVKVEEQIKAKHLNNDSAEFWLRKKYYEADGYGYLLGMTTKGKPYLGSFWSGKKHFVTDKRYKGNLILKYRVCFWKG